MNKIIQHFLKLKLIAVLLPTAVYGAGDFLKNNFSARAVGLGNAYGVIVSDPSALYWNPAGLASINGERTTVRKLEDITKEAEAAFGEGEFSELLDGTSTGGENTPQAFVKVERGFELQWYNAAAVQSLDRYLGFSGIGLTALGGTVGVGALGSLSQGIRGYDENANKTTSQDYHGGAGYLGYARESGSMRWGVSLMGMNEGVGKQAVSGGGLNFGVQVVPIPILSAGFSVQNLLGAVQSRVHDQQKWEKLDTLLRFSLAVTTPPPNANLRLLVGFTSNLDKAQTEGMNMNLGIAYSLNNYSYLMLGVDHGSPAVGFGIIFKPVQFAYSVNRDPLSLGFQHYVELNFAL